MSQHYINTVTHLGSVGSPAPPLRWHWVVRLLDLLLIKPLHYGTFSSRRFVRRACVCNDLCLMTFPRCHNICLDVFIAFSVNPSAFRYFVTHTHTLAHSCVLFPRILLQLQCEVNARILHILNQSHWLWPVLKLRSVKWGRGGGVRGGALSHS